MFHQVCIKLIKKITVKILSSFQHYYFFTVFLNEIPAALASIRDLFKNILLTKTVTFNTRFIAVYCTLAFILAVLTSLET